jgi:C-terminal processing protease CtpA/Prc
MLEQEGYGKPVMVSEVVAGGPAAKTDQIRVRDQLVFVEGIPIAKLSGKRITPPVHIVSWLLS